jgi:hypothetical protein
MIRRNSGVVEHGKMLVGNSKELALMYKNRIEHLCWLTKTPVGFLQTCAYKIVKSPCCSTGRILLKLMAF